MRALLLRNPGGPEALELVGDAPVPEPGPGEVAVDVAAAGVSFPDLLMTRGLYQVRPPLPFTPGIELTGRVAALGEGVSDVAVGERVSAVPMIGGWRERAVTPARVLFSVPDEFDDAEAAGMVVNWHTAYYALHHRAKLQPGEAVLVQGAGGGVGTAAIQVARGLGAGEVIAVARSGAKAELAKRAGADEVLDPDGDWAARAKGRADVVVDPVGGERFDASMRALRRFGRLLVIGFADEGRIPQVALNRILLRDVALVGVNWGFQIDVDRDYHLAAHAALVKMLADGHVHPLLGATYPLERGGEALAAMAERRAAGKLVLTLR